MKRLYVWWLRRAVVKCGCYEMVHAMGGLCIACTPTTGETETTRPEDSNSEVAAMTRLTDQQLKTIIGDNFGNDVAYAMADDVASMARELLDRRAADSQRIEIREEDIKLDTARAATDRGPGGQHVATPPVGVRALHIPTGNSVFVISERSMQRNKAAALTGLRAVLGADSQRVGLSDADREALTWARDKIDELDTIRFGRDDRRHVVATQALSVLDRLLERKL